MDIKAPQPQEIGAVGPFDLEEWFGNLSLKQLRELRRKVSGRIAYDTTCCLEVQIPPIIDSLIDISTTLGIPLYLFLSILSDVISQNPKSKGYASNEEANSLFCAQILHQIVLLQAPEAKGEDALT